MSGRLLVRRVVVCLELSGVPLNERVNSTWRIQLELEGAVSVMGPDEPVAWRRPTSGLLRARIRFGADESAEWRRVMLRRGTDGLSGLRVAPVECRGGLP